jgi:hypothetical protein
VASRCSHRGAHRRLHHSRGGAAEARRVRLPALRPPPFPRRGDALHVADRPMALSSPTPSTT